MENYEFMINLNKLARVNSVRTIGNENIKECINECNKMAWHDLNTHDKLTMNVKKYQDQVQNSKYNQEERSRIMQIKLHKDLKGMFIKGILEVKCFW